MCIAATHICNHTFYTCAYICTVVIREFVICLRTNKLANVYIIILSYGHWQLLSKLSASVPCRLVWLARPSQAHRHKRARLHVLIVFIAFVTCAVSCTTMHSHKQHPPYACAGLVAFEWSLGRQVYGLLPVSQATVRN